MHSECTANKAGPLGSQREFAIRRGSSPATSHNRWCPCTVDEAVVNNNGRSVRERPLRARADAETLTSALLLRKALVLDFRAELPPLI
ncbi:hypothetical protein F1880_007501 [Penicillium rolfsii]|nr:hypothetical protein F1880_007501 [Penicillium rolfsii]